MGKFVAFRISSTLIFRICQNCADMKLAWHWLAQACVPALCVLATLHRP